MKTADANMEVAEVMPASLYQRLDNRLLVVVEPMGANTLLHFYTDLRDAVKFHLSVLRDEANFERVVRAFAE
jgi:hypothetical protein